VVVIIISISQTIKVPNKFLHRKKLLAIARVFPLSKVLYFKIISLMVGFKNE